jgi:glucokinase
VVEDQRIIAQTNESIGNSDSLQAALDTIRDPLKELLQVGGVEALAFGFCGLVDAARARISSTNGKFMDGPEIDLSKWALDNFGLTLRLENDARLALLGERYAGAAQGESDVVMFTLGTGIGGVAMIDGKLVQGKHGQAGVLGGHTPINFRGRRCTCGSIGCAESEASGWALPLVARSWEGFESSELATKKVDFENLFRCSENGDTVAGEVVDHCLNVWGATAVAAVHAFDPELLIFGGGVMKSADSILPFLEKYVRENAWTPWGTVRIRAAKLGNQAALLGAVPLFQQEFVFVR